MARPSALAAVARTVLTLIEDHCPRDEFVGEPRFVLHAGPDGTRVDEGFSVGVWRLAVNTTLRNVPPRRGPDGRMRRPPLPVDLWLLVTPWSTEPERQLRLAGWALRFLDDHPVLPAALLNAALTRQVPPAFGPDESVELVLDAPALADYLGLWDKYRNRWQTPLCYCARMVALESELDDAEYRLVRERDLRAGTPAAPEAAP